MISKRFFRKYKKLAKGFGFGSGSKLIFMDIENRIPFCSSKKSIKLKIPKLGGKNILVRKNTSDIEVVESLLGLEGEYDFLLEEKYKDYLGKADFIIDAGANIGCFTLLAAENSRFARIVSIEAEKENYEILVQNTERYERIKCFNRGLWNKIANLKVIARDTGEWGFIVKEVKKEDCDIEAIDIPFIIDKYDVSKIDILKIDIEGSEYEVFDETSSKWVEFVKMIIIETHDRIKSGCAKRVAEVLSMYGFEHEFRGETDIYIKK